MQRPLSGNIRHSQQTDIRTTGGISFLNLVPVLGFFLVLFVPLIHFVPLNPSLLLHVTYVPYYCPCKTNAIQISVPPVGFEPTIPASERPQTHALARAATEIGCIKTALAKRSIHGRKGINTSLSYKYYQCADSK
jgi:hypothetical protein